MHTVKKGKRIQMLHSDVQVEAFKKNGWTVVGTKLNPVDSDNGKPNEPPKQDA